MRFKSLKYPENSELSYKDIYIYLRGMTAQKAKQNFYFHKEQLDLIPFLSRS